MNPIFIVVFGPPGAGKGTQAKLLAKLLGLPHVATGDLFRQHLQNGTALGLEAQRYMNAGQLVPDDVTSNMLYQRLSEPDCVRGAIIDGFPRNREQMVLLDALLAKLGGAVDIVLNLKVPSQIVITRLLDRAEGRADDTADVIKTRLEVYENQTELVLGLYNGRGIVRTIDGIPSIEEVQKAVVGAVVSVLCAAWLRMDQKQRVLFGLIARLLSHSEEPTE